MTPFKGWHKVFRFTFRQQTRGRSYILTTVIIALAFLLSIPAVMSLVEISGNKAGQAQISPIMEVVVVDETAMEAFDWSFLNTVGDTRFKSIQYTNAADVEEAARDAGDYTLLLNIRKGNGDYALSMILPDKTALTKDAAGEYAGFFKTYFNYGLVMRYGLSMEQMAELSSPVYTAISSGDLAAPAGAGETDEYAAVKEVLSYALPYLVIMTLYFLILAYGQSVATSAIMEKTSKLMDAFLVSIRPAAMILGKLLAIACAGLLQFLILAASIAGGFAAGAQAVRLINPETDMMLVLFLENLGSISGMFTPASVAAALLIIIAGFLLYCSLSAVGASLAGKPEDLSSTNVLFSLILVASFLSTIYSGALYGQSGSSWLDYVPFTAILIVPGRVLLGDLTAAQGMVPLAIITVTMLLFVLLAGKVYTAMSFWKGNPPSPKAIFKMLRRKKETAVH